MAQESSPTDIILDVRDLSVSYRLPDKEYVAVKRASFSLRMGECLGIVGESGSGKSSVAMAIMRYLSHGGRISSGKIVFDGTDLVPLNYGELQTLRGHKISMVYQDPMTSLNPTMRIGRQLRECLVHRSDMSSSQIGRRVVEALASVKLDGAPGILERFPHQISGGQQQRVVIAMALLNSPELIILDEPTTALDVTVQRSIVELLKEIRFRHQTSYIYISHDINLLSHISDRIAVMYRGALVEIGSRRDIIHNPTHPHTRSLISAIPKFRSGVDVKATLDNDDDSGLSPARIHPTTAEKLGLKAPLLVADGISKSFSDQGSFFARLSGTPSDRNVRFANRDISFSMQPGEVLAVVGESGCGKTTLGRIVCGLMKSTAGSLQFEGVDISDCLVEQRPREIVSGIQAIFQNPDATLNPVHTVGYCLSRAIRKFNRAYSSEDIESRLRELLDRVELPLEFRGRLPSQLSGGQKQRVAIARAIAGHPRLIVADEALSALDATVQKGILDLFQKVREETGAAILFIGHDLSVINNIADNLLVLKDGSLVDRGPPSRVFPGEIGSYTRYLVDAIPALRSD